LKKKKKQMDETNKTKMAGTMVAEKIE